MPTAARYREALAVATAEGVELEVEVAGVAARGLAAMVDLFLQAAVVVPLVLLLPPPLLSGRPAGEVQTGPTLARVAVLALVVVVVTSLVAELALRGATPGKRLVGIRVVDAAGETPDTAALLVRNVLRLVDVLPGPYGVGLLTMGLSSRWRRLGDLAAGTLVVVEPADGATASPAVWSGPYGGWRAAGLPTVTYDGVPVGPQGPFGVPLPTGAPPVDTRGWETAGVSPAAAAVLRAYLARRESLPPGAGAQLGARLAAVLRPQVPSAPPLPDEVFLAALLERVTSR